MANSPEPPTCGVSNSASFVHRRRRPAGALRRAFDIVCAGSGLLALSPLLLVIAIVTRMFDGGSVFYTQSRIGMDFKPFRLLKFRTMLPNTEGNRPITAGNDERITPFGRFLRKYKLDELPQLVNVLRGNMQLVGPRPEVEKYVRMFRAEYLILLQDRPGITDPSSIVYRNEQELLRSENVEQQYVNEILPQKLRLSLEYAERRTFISDLKMIFRTIFPGKYFLIGFKGPDRGRA